VQQPGKAEVDVFANPLAIKTREQRSGAGAIETLVVVKDSDFQSNPQVQRIPAAEKRINYISVQG
jgi:hypothetical protein